MEGERTSGMVAEARYLLIMTFEPPGNEWRKPPGVARQGANAIKIGLGVNLSFGFLLLLL